VPDEAVAPSAIRHGPDKVMPRALELNEIPGVIDAFADAARRAMQAGFDTVELHGAHGYLLHAFLSPVANQRTDRYGGSPENRERLMLEVTEAVRAQVSNEKPLFIRLSCEDQAGIGPEQIIPLAHKLKSLGVDVIDCSSGGMRDDMRDIPGVDADRYGYQVDYARQLREATGIRTMAVGHIIHARQAEEILNAGAADIIALGREMLYNPNWPVDAAQKLGEDPDFELLPAYVRGPLASRRRRFEGVSSTFGPDWS
jgi:2,4-dienoyl-CoA reductase-like NADH-dependent reductase (Old Yellow Enzyme family)